MATCAIKHSSQKCEALLWYYIIRLIFRWENHKSFLRLRVNLIRQMTVNTHYYQFRLQLLSKNNTDEENLNFSHRNKQYVFVSGNGEKLS